MPRHKGILCQILTNGEPMEEYGKEVRENLCRSHIIAEEDTSYTFRFDVGEVAAERISYRIIIDGQLVLRRSSTRNTMRITHAVDETGEREIYSALRFRKLTTVGEMSINNEARAQVINYVGEIECRFLRAERELIPADGPNQMTPFKQADPVLEKKLKGRRASHRTELVEEYIKPPSIYQAHSKKLDSEDCPWAIFKFRYASKAVLQAEGLVPLTPTPEPEEDIFEEASTQEIEDGLLKYWKEERKVKIKHETKQNYAESGHNTDRVVIDLEDENTWRGTKRRRIEVVDLRDG